MEKAKSGAQKMDKHYEDQIGQEIFASTEMAKEFFKNCAELSARINELSGLIPTTTFDGTLVNGIRQLKEAIAELERKVGV